MATAINVFVTTCLVLAIILQVVAMFTPHWRTTMSGPRGLLLNDSKRANGQKSIIAGASSAAEYVLIVTAIGYLLCLLYCAFCYESQSPIRCSVTTIMIVLILGLLMPIVGLSLDLTDPKAEAQGVVKARGYSHFLSWGSAGLTAVVVIVLGISQTTTKFQISTPVFSWS